MTVVCVCACTCACACVDATEGPGDDTRASCARGWADVGLGGAGGPGSVAGVVARVSLVRSDSAVGRAASGAAASGLDSLFASGVIGAGAASTCLLIWRAYAQAGHCGAALARVARARTARGVCARALPSVRAHTHLRQHGRHRQAARAGASCAGAARGHLPFDAAAELRADAHRARAPGEALGL